METQPRPFAGSIGDAMELNRRPEGGETFERQQRGPNSEGDG